MSDKYQSFTQSPLGKILVKNLGLPAPTPLERYTAGDPLVEEAKDFGFGKRTGIDLPVPHHATGDGRADGNFGELYRGFTDGYDFLVIDTPGRDDPAARIAAALADTLVTPMNDSFVDFDLIGQVESETFKVRKLSFYAELIWEARLKRSRTTIEQNRTQMDWVVVRNRTGYTEARNMARIEKALTEMSKRVGFRVAKGLSERVIYRELFPSGLTLLDKGHLGDLGTSHLVARQELRGLIANLRLPGPGSEDAVPAAR